MKQFQLKISNTAVLAEITLSGSLTTEAGQKLWFPLKNLHNCKKWAFNLSALEIMDLNGAAQILSVVDHARRRGVEVSLDDIPSNIEPILRMAQDALKKQPGYPQKRLDFFSEIGFHLVLIVKDLQNITAFIGELLIEMLKSLKSPKKIRWPNILNIAETAGVDALPVVCLVSGLVGLIIAFQAAMLMKLFGAEIYVANLVGISVVRELGPLIAGIMLAGRSGSAFSAELGAMKAAEEVDAITTMGLSPVKELALPRVLASVMTTPAVTVIASFIGICGGSLVLMAMGYPFSVYWEGAMAQVSLGTFLIGTGKSVVFGFTLAAIGCQRGLTAGDGPGAVGAATTSGVVTNIVLIAVLDSMFAVLFYVLDI